VVGDDEVLAEVHLTPGSAVVETEDDLFGLGADSVETLEDLFAGFGAFEEGVDGTIGSWLLARG
jgi:hypothetical protein